MTVTPQRLARAFSLLEVLVALLVLGVSVFGMAMLAINSLATGKAAAMQATATLLLDHARELAAVDLLDAAAIGRWRAAAIAALPLPANPANAATVITDPLDATRRTRLLALRWSEPGYSLDRQAWLTALAADWRP